MDTSSPKHIGGKWCACIDCDNKRHAEHYFRVWPCVPYPAVREGKAVSFNPASVPNCNPYHLS